MKDTNLTCTACHAVFPLDRVHPRCELCGEPLEVETVSTGKINEGSTLDQTILERYADFFPFVKTDRRISLREGFTPLLESPRCASHLAIKNILFKNETQNPTWSFKDRGTVTGIQHALSIGCQKIGTVSTGNMAASVAAYGARAGLQTVILVSAHIPSEKLSPIAMYDPILIKVDGDYGELYHRSLETGRQEGIYFINSDVPFRVEGSKTISFEICEQMHFTVPDYVVVPTSSGGNLRGILKGFEEFRRAGLIETVPKIICAQARGCAPIYDAYVNHHAGVSRIQHPDTIAHAIENPDPPSGNEVLRKLRENGGYVEAVTDDEILHAQRRLATEGIFGQPASAVPLAAVEKLRKRHVIQESDTVVCIVTGAGLKYQAVLEKHDLKVHKGSLKDLHRFSRPDVT